KLVPIDRDRSRPEQLNDGRTDEVLEYVDLPVNSLLQLAREVDLYGGGNSVGVSVIDSALAAFGEPVAKYDLRREERRDVRGGSQPRLDLRVGHSVSLHRSGVDAATNVECKGVCS